MGVILYIMLVAEMPFSANTNKGTAEKIINDELIIPKDIASKLSNECLDMIYKCLEK